MNTFGRLALHTWTVDTTPLDVALKAAREGGFDAVELRRTDFKRCFEVGMSNAQVLDLIKKSGIPVGILGVEYGWLFATGEESERLFKVFRESCENAVALNCGMLMSAPVPTVTVRNNNVNAPASLCTSYVRRAVVVFSQRSENFEAARARGSSQLPAPSSSMSTITHATYPIHGRAFDPNCRYSWMS